jgi:2-hydroxycyclohexanecarboxyl-CoA dehydrogenase
MNQSDVVAVVTGAGSGMGRAIAIGLAEEGRRVAAVDINPGSVQDTVDMIVKSGGKAVAFHADISDPAAVSTVRDDVVAQVGNARILVNCAGWEEIHPFMETTPEFRLKNISINLLGAMSVSSAFLEGMIADGQGGRVINISSDAGRVGSTGEVVYSGAKGGLIGFTKALAREMARDRITVNCVAPGPTDTAMLHGAPKKLTDALCRVIPLGRLAQPEDVMYAVRFFASDETSYITGQTLSVSGGLTMAG